MKTCTRCLLVILGLCTFSMLTCAQSSAGTLTISLTVEPSSTALLLPDGTVKAYVANPPANNDALPYYLPPPASALESKNSEQKLGSQRNNAAVHPKPKK